MKDFTLKLLMVLFFLTAVPMGVYLSLSLTFKVIGESHVAIWGENQSQTCQTKDVPEKAQELFLTCMDKAGAARKGRDYTTHDDEDFDEVIHECRRSAVLLTQKEVCE